MTAAEATKRLQEIARRAEVRPFVFQDERDAHVVSEAMYRQRMIRKTPGALNAWRAADALCLRIERALAH